MPHTYTFENGDYNYSNALNYDGRNYYNPPTTITIDGKLFIIGAETSDRKHVVIEGDTVYIVAENKPLDYISMYVIDLSDNSVTDCHLGSNDINNKDGMCYDVFERELSEQVSILSNYLPY